MADTQDKDETPNGRPPQVAGGRDIDSNECIVPPRIPPEALGPFVLSGEAEHERERVRDYVAREAREEVHHVERIKTESALGRAYEVWDVHASKTRWWVITSPLNLYSQELFPSADYTLSFHIGLMARVQARQQVPATDEERDRVSVAWRRLRQADEAVDTVNEAEEFQSVGMRCRECLLALAQGLATPEMVPEGSEAPKAGDFLGWSDLIAGHVAFGGGAEEIRRYLRTAAKATWQYVSWLTHATNAVRFDARIAVDSTGHVLATFIAALIRRERGTPDRCPNCRSYQLDSAYDPVAGEYRALCKSCGWTEEDPAEQADGRASDAE